MAPWAIAGKEKRMNTRLHAVASPGSQQPAGPRYRSIVAVDLEGSTTRTNPAKGELRRVMYDLLVLQP